MAESKPRSPLNFRLGKAEKECYVAKLSLVDGVNLYTKMGTVHFSPVLGVSDKWQ